MIPPLPRWPRPLRLASLLFVANLCLGYAAALLNIHDKATNAGETSFGLEGVLARYRGEGWTADAPGAGAVTYSHLVDITHVHAFSMPILFFLLAVPFACSTVSERAKRVLIAAAFTDIWLNMGALWGIRFTSQPRLWAAALFLSGAIMSLVFAAMALATMRDLLRGGDA